MACAQIFSSEGAQTKAVTLEGWLRNVRKEVTRKISEGYGNNLATIGKCWRHETGASENCQVGDEPPKFSSLTG